MPPATIIKSLSSILSIGKPFPYGPRIPMVWFSFIWKSVEVSVPISRMQNSSRPGLEGVDETQKGASPSPGIEMRTNCPGR
jgi:hypothetical protein